MLRGWPIALVAATGASALFAFGVIQTAFTPQAQALFLVFAAVLFLLVLFNNVFASHGRARHGSDQAVVMSGRVAGAITVIAAVLAVVYFWTDNDLSGEKIGRSIDQAAMSLGRQAQATYYQLTDGRADDPAPTEPAEG
jgi:hypothetical protein